VWGLILRERALGFLSHSVAEFLKDFEQAISTFGTFWKKEVPRRLISVGVLIVRFFFFAPINC
jgi:hypothetical protein